MLLTAFSCLKIFLSDRMGIGIGLKQDQCVSGFLNGHKHFVKYINTSILLNV